MTVIHSSNTFVRRFSVIQSVTKKVHVYVTVRHYQHSKLAGITYVVSNFDSKFVKRTLNYNYLLNDHN